MDNNYPTANLERVLNEFCEEYVEVLKKKLLADGHKASGKLINSLKTEIKATSDTLKVFLTSEDYLFYLDYGRKSGKKPPISAIENWVHEKGLSPEAFDLPNEKSLAYLMQAAIAKNGTLKQFGGDGRGGLYSEKTMNELYNKYAPRLQAALQEDLDIASAKILDEINSFLQI